VKTRLYIEANQILLIEIIGVFEMAIVVNNTLIKIEHSDINAEGQFIFPEEVTCISESAFKYNNNVKTIIVPDTVTKIEAAAFSICFSLTHVILPDSMTEVWEAAFVGCTSITSITLSDSLTKFDEHAFDGCTNLSMICIIADDLDNFEAVKALLPLTLQGKAVYFSRVTALTRVTALMLAGKYSFDEIALALIQAGENLDLKNKDEDTVFVHADKIGCTKKRSAY
jgi:hypothetical protein